MYFDPKENPHVGGRIFMLSQFLRVALGFLKNPQGAGEVSDPFPILQGKVRVLGLYLITFWGLLHSEHITAPLGLLHFMPAIPVYEKKLRIYKSMRLSFGH